MEHHVYFWLKEEHKNEADLAAFEAGLDELLKIPLMTGGIWATPAPVMERPVVDQSWDYATSVSFANVDDQDAYQSHPDHQVFIDKFSTWWERVQVRDLLPGR
ncbi:hypothetical protein HAHE_32720 [Haloferula helveola]|uniref:Stress-response A/B barrel domain-containing protein n=1 Tax=Haloferula helveola TaxID=490095 RepID=A0ABM7RPU3_9BACT|nr:hypothetical protein HAHE_32720 [Haloferula helveola]